jgi:hypothetical protein
MQEDKYAKLTVRVDGAHNIEVEPEFIDPHYTLKSSSVSLTTKTGICNIVSFRSILPMSPNVGEFRHSIC